MANISLSLRGPSSAAHGETITLTYTVNGLTASDNKRTASVQYRGGSAEANLWYGMSSFTATYTNPSKTFTWTAPSSGKSMYLRAHTYNEPTGEVGIFEYKTITLYAPNTAPTIPASIEIPARIAQNPHARAALAAVVAARLHRQGELLRAPERRNEQRHEQRHEVFRALDGIAGFEVRPARELRLHDLLGLF